MFYIKTELLLSGAVPLHLTRRPGFNSQIWHNSTPFLRCFAAVQKQRCPGTTFHVSAPSIVPIRFKNQLLKLQFIQTLYPGILERPKIAVYKICFNF
jgi:hypothetical protein